MKKIILNLILLFLLTINIFSQNFYDSWRLVRPWYPQYSMLVIFNTNGYLYTTIMDNNTFQCEQDKTKYTITTNGILKFKDSNNTQYVYQVEFESNDVMVLTDADGNQRYYARFNSLSDPYHVNMNDIYKYVPDYGGNYNNQNNSGVGGYNNSNQEMINQLQQKISDVTKRIAEHEEMYSKYQMGSTLMLINQEKSLLNTYQEQLQHWMSK